MTREICSHPLTVRLRGGTRAGFTLVEVVAAVFIFVLTIAAVFSVIESSRKAYIKGSESMERYQSVRIGLDRMCRELRSAVSPQSIWNNMPETEEEMEEAIDEATYGEEYVDGEETEIFIRFVGTSSEVTFVTEDITRKKTERYFDLREVRYYVDSEQEALMREIRDSIVRKRMNEFREEKVETETDFETVHPGAFTWDGVGEKTIVAYAVKSMQLAYYDGKEIYDSWDSERAVEREEEEYAETGEGEKPWFDPSTGGWHYGPRPDDEFQEKFGLPDAVSVVLTLNNADEIPMITEIPGRDFDLLMAVNETAFGRRMMQSRVRYNRENNEGPRRGSRAKQEREELMNMFEEGEHSRAAVRREIYDSSESSRVRTRPRYRSSRHTTRRSSLRDRRRRGRTIRVGGRRR